MPTTLLKVEKSTWNETKAKRDQIEDSSSSSLIKLNSFITTIRGDDFYLPLSSSLLARSSEFPQSNDRKTLTTLSLYPRRDPWLLLGTANLLALKHQVLYLDTRLSRPNPSSVTIMYPRQPAKSMDGLLFSRINWPFRGTPCPPIILPSLSSSEFYD